MTFTLKFEVATKTIGTGNYSVRQQVSNNLGNFLATADYVERAIVLSAFDPTNDRISILRVGAGTDTIYVRRFRVEGSGADSGIYYGAWPTESSFTYTADHQDGAGGEDHIGRDTGTGSGNNAFQYDLDSEDFQPAGAGLDWYFAPNRIKGAWIVGAVAVR